MRIETGEAEWVGIEPAVCSGYYRITFGYNDHNVDTVTETRLDELRQIVAAVERLEAKKEVGRV